MQDADRWLTEVLENLVFGEAPLSTDEREALLESAKRSIKEKLLESYRNGQKSKEKPRREN